MAKDPKYNKAYYEIQHVPVEHKQCYSPEQEADIINKIYTDREIAEAHGRTLHAIESKRQNIKKNGFSINYGGNVRHSLKHGYISEADANALMDAGE